MQVDDIQSFADLLRSRKGVESRSAVLHTDRLDIIRGKDFARWYRENSDLVNLPIKQGVFIIRMVGPLVTFGSSLTTWVQRLVLVCHSRKKTRRTDS